MEARNQRHFSPHSGQHARATAANCHLRSRCRRAGSVDALQAHCGCSRCFAPPSWLVGVQVYRIFGGIFLISWARGSIPGVFALPAGIGDVLVGVLALPIALYVSTGTSRGQSARIAWNLLGLTDFAIAIAMGAMSSPGRLQVLSVGQPNVQIGAYPTVMIPAFTVPSSIILHVLSLWQLRRLARKVQGDAR